MAKKKPAKARGNQKDNLASNLVRYRLLMTAIFIAVITAVSLQSTVDFAAIRRTQMPSELNIAKTPVSSPSDQRQPDNHPQSAGPLLMPWRGPVKPLPTEPNATPVILEVPTTDPVVFLTIDDGVTQTPEIGELLTSLHLPFTLFLDDHAIRNDYNYFKRLQDAGMTIQNHTINHPHLKTLNFEQQKAEICGANDILTGVFGQRPTLLRPPYGQYNDDTRRAATECGLKAMVLWRAYVENGQLFYQFDENRLRAGDIVLMHFRPEFKTDLEAFTAQVQKDHLRVGRLEDWLK